MTVLRHTRSLCPRCLRPLDARYVFDGARTVHLEKTCPQHGEFRVPVWVEDGAGERFAHWQRDMVAVPPPRGTGARGCPLDCGLCPAHARRTCCALVEVTQRCNMRCPVCYASAGASTAADPDPAAVGGLLDSLMAAAGPANIQLSGGEPTVRDDVPDIIRLAHAKGFPFVQLNTNGLRLGQEPGYAQKLAEAGLNLVYLQWDGLRRSTFAALRGQPCRDAKEAALKACEDAGLTVVLVATVVRGVNDDELGDLLRKALDSGPHVRGLHLQPVASFGRHPWTQAEAPRLTLPELMHALEEQGRGLVRATDFRPPSSEHALCSFSALYQRTANTKGTGGTELTLLGAEKGCCGPRDGGDEHARARNFVARHWDGRALTPAPGAERRDGLDAFLAASNLRQRFTVSCMAFQDAYSLDLDRLRRCHVHMAREGGRLIPFCACNLTSAEGVAVHRQHGK